MPNKHRIEAGDIMPMAEYAKVRTERKRHAAALKQRRRVAVGPFVTFYFENYATMWQQVHEMLHIEQGGEEQLADELAAYNPLIPDGRELTATFMIEIDDPDRRRRELGRLGGIEQTAFLRLGGEQVRGIPEQDQDRTTAEGKASSVQFVHFRLASEQIARFRAPGAEVTLGLDHPNYRHMAVLPEPVRAELAQDFD